MGYTMHFPPDRQHGHDTPVHFPDCEQDTHTELHFKSRAVNGLLRPKARPP